MIPDSRVPPLEAAARAVKKQIPQTSGDIVRPANWLADNLRIGLSMEELCRGVIAAYLDSYDEDLAGAALRAAIEALPTAEVEFNGEAVVGVSLGSLDPKLHAWYAPKSLLRRAFGLEGTTE